MCCKLQHVLLLFVVRFVVSVVNMNSNKKNIVKKPHNLITAKIHFGVREQNLIQMLMVSVNKSCSSEYFKKEETSNNNKKLVYTYSIPEIAKTLGVTKQALTRPSEDKNTTLIEQSALKLWNYDIWIKDNNGSFEAHRILQRMKFDGEKLMLHLTESYYAEMLKLTEKGFGKIEVGTYYSLKSHVAQRIFELATRFSGMGKVYEVTVGDFCTMIGVELSDYSRVSSFRSCCLKRPIDQIIKLTGDSWERVTKDGYTLIKHGLKIDDSAIIRLDLRPSKALNIQECKNKHKKLIEDYYAIKEMKLNDKNRLLEVLEEIDQLNKNEQKELKLNQDAEFIKNWAALMATSC